jgi:hypothetical protein
MKNTKKIKKIGVGFNDEGIDYNGTRDINGISTHEKVFLRLNKSGISSLD